ncbi:MAG: CCA tRNA nucleotidyltransferase [Marinosulfonomonas sp.]|nr:CCA tRNA nucleotidyltransferase [Marinosulfonomonas sp.]
MDMLTGGGFQAYFVGGCVRNALLEIPVNDIDIATDALPARVMELAQAAGLKAIGTGIEHGTVTVVSDGAPYEITTYRRDLETDGRRAVVAFSGDMAEDAARRDFTMNALYADRRGVVLDPLGGLEDLKNRRVRFIDDANARIREDYLRILRFFRFHAWYGDPGEGLDSAALAAIGENLDGLAGLSKERVGSEIRKLLAAADPAPAVGAMVQAGVLGHVLPGADARFLALLVHFEGARAADPIRRLAVLGGPDPSKKLRLSRADGRQWNMLRAEMAGTLPVAVLGYRHGAKSAVDVALLRAAIFEQAPAGEVDEQAARGAVQVFPVAAADLMPGLQGVALGARLKELELQWVASDFSLTKAHLLD